MRFTAQIIFEAADGESAKARYRELGAYLQQGPFVGRLCQLQAVEETDTVQIFTDGGCNMKKNSVGGWAYVVVMPDGEIVENSGYELETTNNRMEMTAVIRALESIEIGVPIVVTADSEYVIKGITQWVSGWVKRGWVKADGNPVVNRDLWEQLLALYQVHNVKFEWVKGHSGHVHNERCDTLCTAAMAEAHKLSTMEQMPAAEAS